MSNPDALTARYLDVLDQIGWDASIDDDGDLMFVLSELRSDGGVRA